MPHQMSECGTRPFLRWVQAHAWWVQKCLRPCRHSSKKGHLRCQAINLAPLERVRGWEDSSLRLEEWVSLIHKTQLLGFPSSCIKQSWPTKSHQNQTNPIPNQLCTSHGVSGKDLFGGTIQSHLIHPFSSFLVYICSSLCFICYIYFPCLDISIESSVNRCNDCSGKCNNDKLVVATDVK